MRRVVGALVAACVFAAPSVAYAQAGALPVLGFQMAGDPVNAIDQSAPALGSVGVDGIYLAGNGKSVGTPSSTLTAQLARAHQDGVKGVLVLANWSGSSFSETAVNRLVSSASNRMAVERSLAKTVTAQGWDGINIDFEGMTSRDTTGVVSFLRELRAALPAATSLSIDIYNDSSVAAFKSHGFDLAGFAAYVDSAVVMAYDEHGPWTPSTPGPIGELSWQQAGLQTVVSQIPSAKVVLGVAGYGYAWRPAGVVMLSDAQARALCAQYGVTPSWMSAQGEWTAQLSDGSTLWWSDAQSFAARRTLAGQFGLGGLSVWDLGLSDPIT